MDRQTERHAGHLIVIEQDDMHLGFDDALGDAMPPVVYLHGGYRVDNAITPHDILGLFTEEDFIERRSALCDAFDLAGGDVLEIVEDTMAYGLVEDALEDRLSSAMSARDIEQAAELADILGIPHCTVSENGFCQGDVISGLCVATPEHIRNRYGDTAPDRDTIEHDMEADFGMIAAWAFGQGYRGEVYELTPEAARLTDAEFDAWLEDLEDPLDEVLGEPVEIMDQLEMLPDFDTGPFITALRESAAEAARRSLDVAA